MTVEVNLRESFAYSTRLSCLPLRSRRCRHCCRRELEVNGTRRERKVYWTLVEGEICVLGLSRYSTVTSCWSWQRKGKVILRKEEWLLNTKAKVWRNIYRATQVQCGHWMTNYRGVRSHRNGVLSAPCFRLGCNRRVQGSYSVPDALFTLEISKS